MNKYRYLRAGAAVIIGILSVSAFAGLFYPLKIFDLQLTALLQRVLVDFSLFAVILAAALVFFTFLFNRFVKSGSKSVSGFSFQTSIYFIKPKSFNQPEIPMVRLP